MITINETQRKIIHLLNDFGIDRISMAGILGTLEQDNLNENSFLDFIKNKETLSIEECTEQIWHGPTDLRDCQKENSRCSH